MRIKILINLLLTILVSCGNPAEKSSTEDNPNSLQDSESSDTAPIDSVKTEDIAPEVYGEKWERKISVPYVDGEHYLVTKYDFETSRWTYIGKTNEKGVAYDYDISKPTKYVIGDYYESTTMIPKFDFILSQATLPKDGLIAATRIIVPAEEVIFLNGGNFELWAEDIVIDGEIRNYNKFIGGRHGGKVILQAKRVLGIGSLILDGENGRPGNPGSDGRTGDALQGRNCESGGPGSPGQKGGDGSFLEVNFQADFLLSNVMLNAGKGGKGGAGGKGGRFGIPGQVKDPEAREFLANRYQIPRVCPDGANGAVGANGSVGVFKKLRDFKLLEKVENKILELASPI